MEAWRLAPGPETDRLVAERFMGWRLDAAWTEFPAAPQRETHWYDRRGVFTGWATEECPRATQVAHACEVFAPSAESRHAIDVVIAEAVRRGLVYRVAGPGSPGRREVACSLISADGEPLASGRGETTALAVCRAALALAQDGGSR